MSGLDEVSNDLFQEVAHFVDDDEQYRPSPALRKLAKTSKRAHDVESRMYPKLRSRRDRFIAKIDKFDAAVKKGAPTFDAIVQAIASADSFFRGVDIKDIKVNVVEDCQQVARDEIDRRPDMMGKSHAILELLVALLQSRHPVRSDFQVDTASKVGPYTAVDLDEAILEETMGNVSQESLDAAKAIGRLDFSDPASVRNYVSAVNTYRQDSYEGYEGQSKQPPIPCDSYPRVSAKYIGGGGYHTIAIYLALEREAGQFDFRKIKFENLPAIFDSHCREQHSFIDVARALLEHRNGYTARIVKYRSRQSESEAEDIVYLQEWAATAIATSALFSCAMVREIRMHAAFVDMAA